MPQTQTTIVPHLGGITASYRLSTPFSPSKPTLILVNSFLTNAALYDSFFSNEALTSEMNLLAIELLGHGQTHAHKVQHWTYWDTAMMNLQVMEKLGVERAFVLGTSQGGWVTVRMAVLGPEKILGIIPLGTSMDYESERSRELGCWHSAGPLGDLITGEFGTVNNEPKPDFAPSSDFANFLVGQGFGQDCPADVKEFWVAELQKNYKGEEGRKRIRMAAINLRDRDGLHMRLADVVCPVLWLHGTSDMVYSIPNAEEEIKLFTSSPDARLEVIEGGQHFLSVSHPKEVMEHAIAFVNKYAK
ncbi:zinc-binding dehydrogenase [Stemphylium lycopersici]|uniref:Zinc-binding dehydrogenase n=1 Tax=Stemphylium lycopersici TaxID=183478 RepID=A0A364MXQ2_STELY|nr:zinc-binding dehydrogenase [Stemphylium lycopersici]